LCPGTAEAHHLATTRWATPAPLPTPRAALALGVVNGVLYAVGGETWGGAAVATVEAYTPATNTWTTMAPMPSARAKLSVTVADGILYAVGGVGPTNQRLASIEAYDPATNTWSTRVTTSGGTSEPGGGTATGVRLTVNPETPEEAAAFAHPTEASLAALPTSSAIVAGRTGFALDTPFLQVPADEQGVRHVQLPELGRLELRFRSVDAGYLADGTVRSLPWGSSLDPVSGIFTWGLGAGYLGTYRLVFRSGGEQIPVEVTVRQPRVPAAGESQIRMCIDLPHADQVVAGPLTITGWALDPQADIGSGIEAVHVWAQRTDGVAAQAAFLGAAELSGVRRDVGAAFGRQFDQAGYTLTVPPLASGRYEITVYAWNRRTARWEDARTIHVVAQ
jgi:hypothetical protein